MSDSHGQPDVIREAIAVFDGLGCNSIYHLGDICDSAHPETADACFQALKNRRVHTIKGNNDQMIVANHYDRESSPVSKELLEALRDLDLVKYYPGAMFIHSRPFIQELGLSSLIGAMGATEISRYCREFSKQILFRGHSHNSEIAWMEGQDVKARSLETGKRLNLTKKIPCVVTCGALTRGLCMVWEPEGNYIKSISFR